MRRRGLLARALVGVLSLAPAAACESPLSSDDAPTRPAYLAKVEGLCKAVPVVPAGLDLRQAEARTAYRTALRNRRKLYLDLLDEDRPDVGADAFRTVFLAAITAIDASLDEARSVEEGRGSDADFHVKASAAATDKARSTGAPLGLSTCLPTATRGNH